MNHPNPYDDAEYPGLLDRLFGLLLYLLPHHLLSQLMYWLTRCEWRPLKNTLIRAAIRWYRVDMDQAEEPVAENYPNFNAFFTRTLRADARPIDQNADTVACPVDGRVSQLGQIQNGRIFQAKGQFYSLQELLAGDSVWSRRFEDGSFATIYLSPRDYHRVHMPLAGRLVKMAHVPGRQFSVNPSSTRVIPRLFSRNERVISLFESDVGAMAVIMVGAIFVGSMDTVWAGTVTPASRRITSWDHTGGSPAPVALAKGVEMGRFNMGSTVILLFEKDRIDWDDALTANSPVCLGEEIASIKNPQAEDSDSPAMG
jgi:phosphatidylserine decarboxylase